ncbi:MAG: helix-turn-helix domain-containing protein [Dehalococcoidales bacterium]
MEAKVFGTRLRELRIKACLTQRELAEKIGVDFSYLSKIENGVIPPPSEKVILRLAEVLNADGDELITLAGRIPADIAEMLKNQKTLQLLRSKHTQKKVLAKKGEGVSLLTRVTRPKMPTFDYKNFARVAIALVLVVTVGASLWFAAPQPVRALEINFPSLPSGNLGTRHSFSVNVTLGTQDLIPIQSVNITIYSLVDGTKEAILANLPLNAGTKSYSATATGGGAASVTATTATGWTYFSGTGYAYWKGTGYSFGTTYGYGYSSGTGTTTITYSIIWTSPSSWPAGNYKIKVDIKASSTTLTKTFSETSSSFSLTRRAVTPTAPVEGPEPSPTPIVGDVSDIVDEEGVFTEPFTLKSEDENVTLSIPEDTTGKTEEGEPISEISITEVLAPPAPPAGTSFIGLSYDLEPSGAIFNPPITITFTYNPDWLPQGIGPENLAIAYLDEGSSQWVILDATDITIDPDRNIISAKISHFTYFSVIVITYPAAITTSELSITPAEVDIAQSVTISVTVTNTGDLAGSHEVTLKINGEAVSTKKVTLDGHASEKVTFTTVQGAAGTYAVNVDGLSGTFTVKPAPTEPVVIKQPPAPPAPAPAVPAPAPAPPAPVPIPVTPEAPPVPPINWWLIGGIIAAGIIVAIIWFVVSRRRGY